MKHFFFFLFWIPFASFAQIRVDAKGDKLNGHIKKMVEYQYSFFGQRNRNETLDQTAIYTYDEKTNQEMVYSYWGSESTRYVYRDVFKYYGNKLTEHRHIQKVSHGVFMENDSIYYIVANKYDDSNRLIESNAPHSGIDFKTSYIYEGGNVAEKNEYFVDGSFGKKSKFKYDSKGYVVTEDIYDDRCVYHTTYKYENNYHYSEEHTIKIDTNCDREWKTIHRYDNRMNLIEETTYYGNGGKKGKFQEQINHIQNKYTYDDNGNWVERTNYLHGKKHSYIKRVITY